MRHRMSRLCWECRLICLFTYFCIRMQRWVSAVIYRVAQKVSRHQIINKVVLNRTEAGQRDYISSSNESINRALLFVCHCRLVLIFSLVRACWSRVEFIGFRCLLHTEPRWRLREINDITVVKKRKMYTFTQKRQASDSSVDVNAATKTNVLLRTTKNVYFYNSVILKCGVGIRPIVLPPTAITQSIARIIMAEGRPGPFILQQPPLDSEKMGSSVTKSLMPCLFCLW